MAFTGGLIAGAGAAAVGTSVLTAIAVGAAAAAVIDYAITPEIPEHQGAQPTMLGRNITTKNPVDARDVVYGQVRKGGTIVYQSVSGHNNKLLHQVIALATGKCQSIDKIYFGSEKVWENGSKVGRYNTSGVLHVSVKTGADNQAVVNLIDDSQWSANKRLLGIAYIAITFVFNNDVYPNGVPTVSAVMKGKTCYDPRGSASITQPEHWAFSRNPVICLYDYLRSSDYGANLDNDLFDEDQITEAANYCDQSVSSIIRYRCDGVLSTKGTIRENIKSLLSSMNGKLLFVDGKFRIEPSKYQTPSTKVVNEDMIISSFVASSTIPRKQQYNKVKGEYIAEHDNYIASEYPPQTDSTYQSNDGNELSLNVNFPFTTNIHLAQRLARQILKKSRRHKTVKFKTDARGFTHTVGDNILLSNYTLGITDHVYEITNMKVNISNETGITCDIEARENSSDAYNGVTGFEVAYTGETSDLPEESVVFTPEEPQYTLAPAFDGEGNPATAVNIIIPEVQNMKVKYYEVQVGKRVNNRYLWHARYTPVTNTVTHIEKDHLGDDELYLRVRVVNIQGKHSSFTDLQTIDISNKFEGTLYGQNIFYGDPDVAPSFSDFVSYFGRQPVDGDEITVIEKNSQGVVLDAKTYIFVPDELSVVIKQSNVPQVYSSSEQDAVFEAVFSVPTSELQGATVTWSYAVTNFDYHVPTGITIPTTFHTINLTSGTIIGDENVATLNVQIPYSYYENVIDEHSYFVINRGDVTVTASYSLSGVPITKTKTITVALAAVNNIKA